MRDRPIDDVLAELGFAGEKAELARLSLEDARLTRPGKERIAEGKLERVREALDAVFARVCAECARRAPGEPREVVVVAPPLCTACGSSDNRRAIERMAGALRGAGLRRVVVVGGSPSVRKELASHADVLELRLVDGTERRTRAEARGDTAWADVVVVCGASELDHKVSKLYTDGEGACGKLVRAPRRGAAAIADEVTRHLERRR